MRATRSCAEMERGFLFDVFGTCVDWRSSVAREVAAILPEVDADAFAVAWRAEYDPAMARIRDGARGYVPLDQLHLENLERVAERFGVTVTDPAALNRAWEKLDPWADVVSGLHGLRRLGLIAPCSNGSIALMSRLARYSDLPWDAIAGAELARDYKPQAAVYHASCAALGLPPERVVMVAAHNSDLHGARAAGLKTAFVVRPTEHGPGQEIDLKPDSDWDYVSTDFNALARDIEVKT